MDTYRLDTTDLSFRNNLYSIYRTMPEILTIAKDKDKQAQKILDNYVEQISTIITSAVSEKDANYKKRSKPDLRSTCLKIIDICREADTGMLNVNISAERTSLLLRSFFILLISFFDFLISDLIKTYYTLFPGALDEKMSLTLLELKTCKDIDEALNNLVNKKIESVLYKSFKDQMLFFNNELKVNTEDDIVNWDIINEMILRRNIIVHNNGKVTKHYQNNIHIQTDNVIKLGDKLEIDEDYFFSSFFSVFVCGEILYQNSMRKWAPESNDSMDSSLLDLIEKFFMLNNVNGAFQLSIYAKRVKTATIEKRQLLDMQYCVCLKKLNRIDELQKELSKFDESMLDSFSLVALTALKNDKTAFYKGLRKAAANKQISLHDISDSFFEDIRQDPEYKKLIEDVFPRRYSPRVNISKSKPKDNPN
jgi:hypothetical protein